MNNTSDTSVKERGEIIISVSNDEITTFKSDIPLCNDDEARKVLSLRAELKNTTTDNPTTTDTQSDIEPFSSYSNMALLRFLRAKKGDYSRTYRALIKNNAWKQEFVPTIDPNEFIDENASGKLTIAGYDLLNRPVLRIDAAKHNKNRRDVSVLKKFLIHTMEQILTLTIPQEEKITLLFDLSGFSYNCMDYEVVRMFVSMLELNYPEILSTAYILNSPFIFSACWVIIKPWIDPVTAMKVKFISSSEYSTYFPAP